MLEAKHVFNPHWLRKIIILSKMNLEIIDYV